MAQLFLPLVGQGEAELGGRIMPGGAALRRAAISPPALGPKDAIALLNANAYGVGLGALALHDARLALAVNRVLGRKGTIVLSPGTYDHKHVARIAGVPHCVAYGPGALEQAHQPDERCSIDDFVTSIRVLALAVLDLVNGVNPSTPQFPRPK